MIYLDWNATAPLHPAARTAWLDAVDRGWGNPASIHAVGQRARHAIDQAKRRIGGLLGCGAEELVVTSGGSEANATAIHGALRAAGGGDVLISAIEHSSVTRNAEAAVAAHAGSRLQVLPVDGDGRLAPATLAAACTPRTRLVCVQYANNETGTLQDIPALVAAVRRAAPDALVHVDACQGAGKRALDLRALRADLASVAGHKFGAPIGIGLLHVRAGLRLGPLIAGGRQQQDRRSGTEDVAGVSALAAALAAASDGLFDEEHRQTALLDACFARVAAALPDARWLARAAPRLANTMLLLHPGVDRHALVPRLDLAGCCVSPGAACAAGRDEPSPVVAALGVPRDLARSAVRVSIGKTTTAAELSTFAEAYVREVRGMLA